MKKSISNLGKTLTKKELQNTNGETICPNNPRGMCLTGYTFNFDICKCIPDGFSIP